MDTSIYMKFRTPSIEIAVLGSGIGGQTFVTGKMDEWIIHTLKYTTKPFFTLGTSLGTAGGRHCGRSGLRGLGWVHILDMERSEQKKGADLR